MPDICEPPSSHLSLISFSSIKLTALVMHDGAITMTMRSGKKETREGFKSVCVQVSHEDTDLAGH